MAINLSDSSLIYSLFRFDDEIVRFYRKQVSKKIRRKICLIMVFSV
jgi:hypothetical protein